VILLQNQFCFAHPEIHSLRPFLVLVSPELAQLLRRVKTIYAICGGEVPQQTAGKKDDFTAKKSILIAQLHNFDALCDARDNCGLAKDSRDYIRLKNTVNVELQKLTESLNELGRVHKKEVEKKGSKMTAAELEARSEIMSSIVAEFQSAYKHAKGYSHAGADENLQGGTAVNALTTEQLMKGQFAGAGLKSKTEALTGEQLQQLEQITGQVREQDQILDEISKGIDELQELAEKMSDELQLQDKMLTDLENKTDKTQTKLDSTNDRMKDALAKINDKSSNMCMYAICIVMLLGIAMVIYNMIINKKK
jgi:chromosome segregation ATPase